MDCKSMDSKSQTGLNDVHFHFPLYSLNANPPLWFLQHEKMSYVNKILPGLTCSRETSTFGEIRSCVLKYYALFVLNKSKVC